MRNIIQTGLLILTLGCGATLPPPVHAGPDLDESSTGPTSEGRRLSIAVPNDWIIASRPPQLIEGMTTVFLAQAPTPVGRRSITVAAHVIPWEGESEEFAASLVAAASDFEGLDLIEAQARRVSGVPAALVVSLKSDDVTLITQVGVAFDHQAYLVTCTSDALQAQATATCRGIMDELSLEPGPSDPGTL